jgi:FkbM family methyltransferase
MRPTKLHSLQLLRQRGLPVESIIDVGVHQQTKDLIDVFPDRRHILIEPAIEFHDAISANYASIDHVLIPKACGEEEGSAFLNVFDISGAGGISHTTITPSPQCARHRVIGVTTLHTIIGTLVAGGELLLKVDVDGLELPILKGASDRLQRCSCVIVEASISYDNGLFYDRINFMRSQGFELWDIVDFCYYKDCLSQVDVVFLRHEIKASLLQFNPWHDGQVFDGNRWVTLFQ